jgi:hypothetical protein
MTTHFAERMNTSTAATMAMSHAATNNNGRLYHGVRDRAATSIRRNAASQAAAICAAVPK